MSAVVTERAFDVDVNVRVQALDACKRLQDPFDPDCHVIAVLKKVIDGDQSFKVREIATQIIAISKLTYLTVSERCRDVHESVRKAAFQALTKVNVRCLSIEQRIKLLSHGLNDNSVSVRKIVCETLLETWLHSYGGDIVQLLRALDIESAPDLGEHLLLALFKQHELDSAVSLFKLLNSDMLIDLSNLCSESALYWRCLCKFMKLQENSIADEYMDKLLPTLTVFCNYLMRYLVTLEDSARTAADIFSQTFILQELFSMLDMFELRDEFGREQLQKFMFEALVKKQVSTSLVAPLLSPLPHIVPGWDCRIELCTEAIEDIWHPVTLVQCSFVVSEEAERAKKVQIATMSMKILEKREQLSEAIKNQKAEIAANLKKELLPLEEEFQRLKDGKENEEMQPLNQEVRSENDDPASLRKCLALLTQLLKYGKRTSPLHSTVLELKNALVLPCIQHEDPNVRLSAIEALIVVCLQNVKEAKQHLVLFIQIMTLDVGVNQKSALIAVSDILLLYGFQTFEENDSSSNDAENDDEKDDLENDSTKSESDQTPVDKSESLLNSLVNFLDNENAEILEAAAVGLAKLLLWGRINSPEVVSRLLLLWATPTASENGYLQRFLGDFLPRYSLSRRVAQTCMAEAVLPTMNALFAAPAYSPLARVDVNNLTDMLVAITDSRRLPNYKPEEPSVQDSLAEKLCEEILNSHDHSGIYSLCRMLNNLCISTSNSDCIDTLLTFSKDLIKTVRDKRCTTLLKKFNEYMKVLSNKNQPEETGDTSLIQNQEDENDTVFTDDTGENLSLAMDDLSLVQFHGIRKKGSNSSSCSNNQTIAIPEIVIEEAEETENESSPCIPKADKRQKSPKLSRKSAEVLSGDDCANNSQTRRSTRKAAAAANAKLMSPLASHQATEKSTRKGGK